MTRKTECMIRLDDITPDMDWEKFFRVKEILDRHQIFPLIGVVPDNQDSNLHKQDSRADFWEKICSLQNDGWSIAQHGTSHCYKTQDGGILGINPFSEFAGLPYEEQLYKVLYGKRILEKNQVFTNVFMAPGHTYDRNTLKALKECGFLAITDGLCSKPYWEEGILCIPCRLREFKTPSGIDTICLHTNLMDEQDWKQLDLFCAKNRDVIVSFDPNRYKEEAGRKTLLIKAEESMVLNKRRIKNKIAESKRLAWYLEKTAHKSGKVKWAKRFFYLPLLLCYRKEKKEHHI